MTTGDHELAAQGGALAERPERGGPDFVWVRFSPDNRDAGQVLAALRSGIGRGPGDAPQMWRHYRCLDPSGRVGPRLRAEHVALTLFAVHQQSSSHRVHEPGRRLGSAMLRLRQSGEFSEQAIDRRFAAAATASTLDELAVHLRGLVGQLRSLSHGGLDYTLLHRDLLAWQDTRKRPAVTRRWGLTYFGGMTGEPDGADSPFTAALHDEGNPS